MFGFKRRRVTAWVLNNVRPMFRMVEISLGRIPDDMRSDPYVLGYFMSTVASLAAVTSNNSIKGSDAGMVLRDVAEGVFGIEVQSTLKRMMSFHSEGNNVEFRRGVENARKVVVIAFGLDQLLSDPDVKRARAQVGALGSSLDLVAPNSSAESQLAGNLQQLLFYDYVQHTYGQNNPRNPYVEALDLEDKAFTRFVADAVSIGPPSAWTMYVLALPNVKVWMQVSAELSNKSAGKTLPDDIDGFIRLLAKTIEERSSDVEKDRLNWQIVTCMVLKATQIAERNDALVDDLARIWLALIQGGAGIQDAVRYNQVWSAEEKEFFRLVKSGQGGMKHVLHVETPPFIRRHPAIEQFAEDKELGFFL